MRCFTTRLASPILGPRSTPLVVCSVHECLVSQVYAMISVVTQAAGYAPIRIVNKGAMLVARRALTCPQFRPRATVLRPRLQAVIGNVRVLSTSPPPSEQPVPSTPPKTDVPEEVIYTGAHGPVIKTLKRCVIMSGVATNHDLNTESVSSLCSVSHQMMAMSFCMCDTGSRSRRA